MNAPRPLRARPFSMVTAKRGTMEGDPGKTVAIPTRMTRLAAFPIVAGLGLVAGCGAAPQEARRSSEPTDAFYPRASGDDEAYPSVRRRRRDPRQSIVTRLRPTELKGRFPTSYLYAMTHLEQPYAKTIWDKATAGLSLSDLTPLPVARSTPWRRNFSPNDLVLKIGGYSSSSTMTPEQLAAIVEGRVERSSAATLVGEKRLTHHFFPDDLSGRPKTYHVLRCRDVCSGTPTLAMSAAGEPPLDEAHDLQSVTGLAVRVNFHAGQIPTGTRSNG